MPTAERFRPSRDRTFGPRTAEQLDVTLRATEIHLDEGTLAALDEIFPGPGGPAPEAYAW